MFLNCSPKLFAVCRHLDPKLATFNLNFLLGRSLKWLQSASIFRSHSLIHKEFEGCTKACAVLNRVPFLEEPFALSDPLVRVWQLY